LQVVLKSFDHQPKSLRADTNAVLQAQGLTRLMGGAEAIRDAVHDQDFSSFAGLVTALEHAFAS